MNARAGARKRPSNPFGHNFFMFSKRLKAAENLHFRKERFSKSSEVFGKYKQKYKHEEKGQFLR